MAEEQQEEVQEVEEAPVEEAEKDPKDRTAKEFEKLKGTNQELKRERDEYKNLFESLRPNEVPQKAQEQYDQPINQAPSANQFQNLNQADINQAFQSMVDENGYLDGNKLIQTLGAMNERATRAEQAAARIEKKAQEAEKKARETEESTAQKEVHKKYPQLDPNNEEGFNPKFWKAVFNELGMKAKSGVMPSSLDYMKAADEVYQDFFSDEDMTKKQQAAQTEDQKKQINSVRPQSTMTKGYYEKAEHESLVHSVRSGKKGALAEMLRRRGQ